MPAAARSGGDLRLRDEEAEMTQLLLRAAEAVDEEPGTGTETAKAEAMARLATGDGGGGGGWRSVRHGTARHGALRLLWCWRAMPRGRLVRVDRTGGVGACLHSSRVAVAARARFSWIRNDQCLNLEVVSVDF
jgi:hypothetical protein